MMLYFLIGWNLPQLHKSLHMYACVSYNLFTISHLGSNSLSFSGLKHEKYQTIFFLNLLNLAYLGEFVFYLRLK